MNKGVLLIISGPSGAGKGTVVEALCKEYEFSLSISATTREPRAYEENGVHYFFHTREEFKKMQEEKELLEWAEFCGNFYGTPKNYVIEQLNQGKNVILEIEVQGALQVKDIYSEGVLIFLMPPTLKELESRLLNRDTETKDVIDTRLKRASEEIELLEKYDYIVINETIEKATQDIDAIVRTEQMRSVRNMELKKTFIKGEHDIC